MLPMLGVGWQASALRGAKAVHFREVAGVSIVSADCNFDTVRANTRSIEKHLAVLWMLASFLRCHSTTETLNPTV